MMRMSEKMLPRADAVYVVIQQYRQEHGRAPTRRQIADQMGWTFYEVRRALDWLHAADRLKPRSLEPCDG